MSNQVANCPIGWRNVHSGSEKTRKNCTVARALLDQRYGDPFVIANAFRGKIDSWPKINARDSQSLLKFADFLKQCLAAMNTISSLSILNDSHENRKMLSKLPEWLINRWNRIGAQRKEQRSEFPSFKDFVEFVGKEANIACDPITSPQSLKVPYSTDTEKAIQQPQGKKRFPGSRTLLSDVKENAESGSAEAKTKGACALCKGKHELDVCKAFLSKSLAERKAFIRERSLCYGCLQTGHVSKRCRQRKKCSVCSKFHPSSLHGDVKGQSNTEVKVGTMDTEASLVTREAQGGSASDMNQHSQSGVVFLGNTGQSSKCSMILPVYLSHRDSPEKEILIYALLDTQSETTFILQDSCSALRLTGIDVKLSLSTMYAENRVVDSQKINGLMVRGFDNSMRISLPDAYTRNIMPANRSHIPTPDIARSWSH